MLNGFRVCAQVASEIREIMDDHRKHNGGHIPVSLVKQVLKPMAEEDARMHMKVDPEFRFGFGPAVERHQ